MGDFVLDASVTLAQYLPATVSQREYAAKVTDLIRNGAVPLVPALWGMEIGAVLIRFKRSKTINATLFDMAMQDLEKMPFDVHDKIYGPPDIVSVAKAYNLQGYDAVYFDVAKSRGLPLASLDKGHRTACRNYGVKLLAF